jgi:tRNA G37 N-methylase Trm5
MVKRDDGEQKLDDFLEKINVELNYEDLRFEDVMKAILPDDLLNENITAKGYSVIGHIAHFNLREKILDYKHLIGKFKVERFKFLTIHEELIIIL